MFLGTRHTCELLAWRPIYYGRAHDMTLYVVEVTLLPTTRYYCSAVSRHLASTRNTEFLQAINLSKPQINYVRDYVHRTDFGDSGRPFEGLG